MQKRTIVLACSFLVVMLTLASPAGADDVRVSILSGRPDMITGGDALVRIDPLNNASLTDVVVKLNGLDVSANFRVNRAPSLVGLLTGLKIGENTLQVFLKGQNRATAQHTLKNHPATGPVFSGKQEQPFICQTEAFRLPDGAPLGAPLDADCSVRTIVTYVYKSTTPVAPAAGGGRGGAAALNLKGLASGATSLPPDVAYTTTSTGQKVPYVVRVETGTLNRGIYQFSVLHDPTAGAQPGPMAPPPAWNGRLLYSFGGGCPGGWLKQGVSIGNGGVISDAIVGKGYAEASSTLNVAGNNCNDTISAETMMMVKERFIEAYGAPLFTFSRGGSGGSYQQNQIAENYPGLIDGIMPSANYPDVQALTQMLTDSRLLLRYYNEVGSALTTEQQRAIAGVVQASNVANAAPLADRNDPTKGCPEGLPEGQRYHAVNNRSGVRCDVYDHNINQYGRDPQTGFARRPIDNVGVQYGLEALNSGTITTSQFFDLNEHIGGYDNDGNVVKTRSKADPLSLRAAYQHGLITYGGGGLSLVPIIDVRGYRDKAPAGEHHLKYHSFSYRERIRKATGTTAHQILLVSGDTTSAEVTRFAFEKMDEWLTALKRDTSSDSVLTKITRAKPSDLVDSCWSSTGERIAETQSLTGGGQCTSLFPTFGGPRMVAGGPLSNDVLKCQLRPIDVRDYKVSLTAAERTRLGSIFPTGVCDYAKPGVEQQKPIGTWQKY